MVPSVLYASTDNEKSTCKKKAECESMDYILRSYRALVKGECLFKGGSNPEIRVLAGIPASLNPIL